MTDDELLDEAATEGYELLEVVWDGQRAWKWRWIDPGFQPFTLERSEALNLMRARLAHSGTFT